MTPEGWRSAELGAIAQVNPEQLKHRTDPDYVLEYLDIAAIERPGVIGASRTLTLADAPSRARRRARAGDILVSTVRPYLRNFARVGEAPSNLVASTGYAVVRPANGVDGRFLYQHVLSDAFVEFLKPRMRGSNYPAVKADDVKTYTLSLPPLPEQRKIAAILSSLDDAIEKTQAVIDQVQVVKRGLMQDRLTRGLPGRHTRFKQTEIGEIPEEWEVRALVDCCNGKGQYGANVAKADFKPGGIRYIRITDIDDNGALRDNAVGISGENADGYLLQLGDILFARSGATVGKAYMHRDPGMRSAFAGYLVRFRTKRDVLLPTFLREYLNTDVYWRWVGDRQRAQAQPNINATEYGQLPVPCAPLDEQRRVMEIAESFNSSLLRARAEVLGKQWLKRALMPVLLTGELRVTPGPEVA